MRDRGWIELGKYVAALGIIALSATIPLFVGISWLPWVTYFVAIIAVGWFFGLRPTLAAIVFGWLTAGHFHLPPADSIIPERGDSWMSLALFAFVGVVTAVLSESRSKERGRADVRSKQVLQERARFEVTVSSIGDAVIVTDIDTCIVSMNAVAEALTGWTQQEAAGRPLLDVFRVLDELTREPAANPALEALREGRKVASARHALLIRKDGAELAIDDSAAPIREDDEIAGVVLVFRDVTERRRSEIDRNRLAAIVESSEDAIAATSLDGIVTAWNGGATRLFGFALSEVLGKPLSASIVPPDRTHEPADVIDRVRRGESVPAYATTRMRKDGTPVPVSVMVSPIRDASGATVGVSAILRDITQQRKTERRRAVRLAVTQIVAQDDRPQRTIPRVLEAMCEALEWDVASFWEVDLRQQQLRCAGLWHCTGGNFSAFQQATLQLRFERGIGLPGEVWRSGRPLWVRDVLESTNFPRASAARIDGLRGAFACPVAVGDLFLGVLELFSRRVQEPDDDLLEIMTTISGQIGQFLERKRAEERLRASEEEFRATFDSSAVGQVQADPETRQLVRVNRKFCELTGYSAEELTALRLADLTHIDDRALDRDRYARLLKGELVDYRVEKRLIRKTGETIWAGVSFSAIRDRSGRALRAIGVVQDITARLRAEETVRSLLRISERLNSTLDVDDLLDLLVKEAIDLAGAESGVAGLYTREGMVARRYLQKGNTLPLEYCWPPDHGLPGWLIVHKVPYLTNDSAADPQIVQELCKQFGVHSALSTPILNSRRELLGFFEIHNKQDGGFTAADQQNLVAVSQIAAIAIENALAYRQVRDAEQALKEADRRKDEFLAMLAHELRNPLAPIRSGLDVLALSGIEPENVSLMQEQLAHLVHLVDDLLDVSRMMRGKIQLRKETLDLGPVVSKAAAAMRPTAAEHEHQLHVSIPPSPMWVSADPVRLTQVISNLLSNACKYTDAHGQIWLKAERQNGEAVISVRDTGVGIDPAVLPRVFDLFVQADHSIERSHGGLGIGLTLVRSLVEMHGGEVSARSDGKGHGCEFVVRLPVCQPAEQETAEPDLEPAAGTFRVLVVDDNVGAAKMLALVLTQMGASEVAVAHDGPSAIEKAVEFRPDVALLDIGMPGMSGYDVAQRLREIPSLSELMLVALTGYGAEEDRRKSREAGFDEHLVKPAALEDLRRVLGRLRTQHVS